MTWVSHILVGSSVGKLFGYGYVLSAFGSVLPDLIENIAPVKHRGISHSLTIWLIVFVIAFLTNLQQALAIMIGVLIGHLLMDSLTVTGVPLFDDRGRYITLFGGRLRTGTPSEYIIAILIAGLCTLAVFSGGVDLQVTKWKLLYEQGIIDQREYRENRFRI
ncbi:MAG: metal-dependent hydrolase [Thermodesulfovibrionales bacterium]